MSVLCSWARHHVILVGAIESLPDSALGQIPRFDRDVSVVVGFERAFGDIEPELGFAFFGVEAVAGEAILGENGTDIAVELEAVLGGGGGGEREKGTGDRLDDGVERGGTAHRERVCNKNDATGEINLSPNEAENQMTNYEGAGLQANASDGSDSADGSDGKAAPCESASRRHKEAHLPY